LAAVEAGLPVLPYEAATRAEFQTKDCLKVFQNIQNEEK
jgi:hypothetical protein